MGEPSPPLHEVVAERLRQHITRHCRPGDRLETLRTLMRLYGVSHSTLRAAQALLCHEGLLEVRHGSGAYVTEQAFRKRVAVWCELDILHPRTTWYHSQLPRALRRFFREHGLDVDLYLGDVQPGEPPEGPTCLRFVEDLNARRMDGIVLVGTLLFPNWLKTMRRHNIPTVGQAPNLPYGIAHDREGLLVDAIAALHEQGCRRLALLAAEGELSQEQFAGQLAGFGMTTQDAWFRSDLDLSVAGGGWEAFRELWLTAEVRPDGLIVMDELIAEEVAQAITELEISVPDSLRVVSQHTKGAPLPYPFPTTLLQLDLDSHAAQTGRLLLDLLYGRYVVEPRQLQRFERLEFTPERVGSPLLARLPNA